MLNGYYNLGVTIRGRTSTAHAKGWKCLLGHQSLLLTSALRQLSGNFNQLLSEVVVL